MEEAIRVLEAAKQRNIDWMKRIDRESAKRYKKKNESINKALNVLKNL